MRYHCLKTALLLSALIAFGPADAFAARRDRCNDYLPAKINVQTFFDPVDYQSTPMLKIRAVEQKINHEGRPEAWPVGLSTGELYLQVTTDVFKMHSGTDNFNCGQVRAITVRFGFKDNTIYVAKEFPRRSCPFRTVLEHEEKHKTVDRAILEEFSKQMETRLKDVAEDIGMLQVPVNTAVDQQISDRLHMEVDKITQEIQEARGTRQSDIDTTEEYERISQSCDGQLREVVNDRLELLELSSPGITQFRIQKKPEDKKVADKAEDTTSADKKSDSAPATAPNSAPRVVLDNKKPDDAKVETPAGSSSGSSETTSFSIH
jgi:hypothetical protein